MVGRLSHWPNISYWRLSLVMAKEGQQNWELYQSNEIGSRHQDMRYGSTYYSCNLSNSSILSRSSENSTCNPSTKLPSLMYRSQQVHIIDKVNPLEYQQNKFSLQFCPAYNLPIWLHITSADFWLMSAYMEPNWKIVRKTKMQTKVILLVL